LLRKEWLEVKVTQLAEIVMKEVDTLEKIKKSKAKDDKQ